MLCTFYSPEAAACIQEQHRWLADCGWFLQPKRRNQDGFTSFSFHWGGKGQEGKTLFYFLCWISVTAFTKCRSGRTTSFPLVCAPHVARSGGR